MVKEFRALKTVEELFHNAIAMHGLVLTVYEVTTTAKRVY